MEMCWTSGSTGRVVDMFVVGVVNNVRGTKSDKLRTKSYKFHSKSPWDSCNSRESKGSVLMNSNAYSHVYETQTPAMVHAWTRRNNFSSFLLICNKILRIHFNIILCRPLSIPRFLFSWGFSTRLPYAFLMFP